MFLASVLSSINYVRIPTVVYMRGAFCLGPCSNLELDVCFIGLIIVLSSRSSNLPWECYKPEADLAEGCRSPQCLHAYERKRLKVDLINSAAINATSMYVERYRTRPKSIYIAGEWGEREGGRDEGVSSGLNFISTRRGP